MLVQFTDAVKTKGPAPIDVYDSAVMTAIVELSGFPLRKMPLLPSLILQKENGRPINLILQWTNLDPS
jgi:hypothetical protein